MLKVKRFFLCLMIVPALVAGLNSCKDDDDKGGVEGKYTGTVTMGGVQVPGGDAVVVDVTKAEDGDQITVKLDQTVATIPLDINVTSPVSDNKFTGNVSVAIPANLLLAIAPESVQPMLEGMAATPLPLAVAVDGTFAGNQLSMNLVLKLPAAAPIPEAMQGASVATLVYVGKK